MRNLSDYELMRLIKGKQHKALAILYDRYASLVYSFAMKALKDEQAARDIVQSVFLRLWTTESDYNPDKGRFSSWLITITRNLTIDWQRKERRGNIGLVALLPEELERIPDEFAPSPEDSAVRDSQKERIRAAYRHLTKQQIMLLEHFYWQGFSLSELAALYNQPLGTVKNRLHQALKILRRHLLAEGEGM
ncbi:RNA polymerase sigma factor [Paenibacillus arenilitoris]|uniref:Sigma-70 family RNA polymerase sigma factor n=1 Tax=Paenibacillus arenilitoris TaxID=2772299 RepID=A0A927CN66_9BACL|nr:sigma-70 family RNA polymerase sigma factor [Paenibacillus arenilitoris]MBD2868675.1 sigma-70 family RNA polymerase sigma factor [Paenibacillus arenilitoris]